MQSCPVVVVTQRVGLCLFLLVVGVASVEVGNMPKVDRQRYKYLVVIDATYP
jgi:hypothetical protein